MQKALRYGFKYICKECLHISPAYKNITFYGSFHNSHEILTNWLMNVDNFVQRQSALLNIYVTGPRQSPRKNRDLGPNADKLIFFIKSKTKQ